MKIEERENRREKRQETRDKREGSNLKRPVYSKKTDMVCEGELSIAYINLHGTSSFCSNAVVIL